MLVFNNRRHRRSPIYVRRAGGGSCRTRRARTMNQRVKNIQKPFARARAVAAE